MGEMVGGREGTALPPYAITIQDGGIQTWSYQMSCPENNAYTAYY